MKIGINGTGIAGPTLAWWLKKYGHEPVLFERAPVLRTGGYVIDFWGLGYDIAEMMGLIPAIRRDGYQVTDLLSVDKEGKTRAQLPVSTLSEILKGRFTSLTRSHLVSTIFDALEGVETRFGLSIVALKEDNDGVNVTLSDGSTDRFDLIIGADGLHSHIRSLVFGEESEFEHDLGVYVAAFSINNYPHRNEDQYVVHPEPNCQISRFSMRDNKTLILFTFRKELIRRKPANEAEEKALLHDIYGHCGWEAKEILGYLDAADDFYFDTVSQIQMPQWSKGRVALIGDAAACASLLAGEGTGLGMTEAYTLAGELHKARGDYKAAFATYEAELRAFLSEKQKAASKMVTFFAAESQMSIMLVRLGLHLASLPLFTRIVLGSTVKDNYELKHYI
jgi:2-polyprenyl-6-methoxyphenol hydroxylase-like FAD-dependent oxidoreductase